MNYKIYDIFTKQDIFIPDGEVMKRCRELGIDNTALAKIGRSVLAIKSRYIHEKDKDKIFTLVEFETGKEYDCISNDSLFAQLGIDQATVNANETKYIYELKKGRQIFASICGKIFKLKNGPEKRRRYQSLKVSSPKYDEILKAKELERKMVSRIRGRITKAVKYKLTSNTKKDRTLALLGCSISFYMGFLSAKFLPGMSWDNYGFWEIDHIVPCASFQLSSLEEQQKCFHYTNTQPMWAKENQSKNDRSPEEWEKYKAEKLKIQETIENPSSFSYPLAEGS